MSAINLRQETADILKENGKTAGDVLWVQFGAGKFYCSFDEFMAAANFQYDNGFGGNEIDLTLKVVGDGWWLERGEYDGSEWWEYKSRPDKPEMHRVPVQEDFAERL